MTKLNEAQSSNFVLLYYIIKKKISEIKIILNIFKC